jgi:hypothetical protein
MPEEAVLDAPAVDAGADTSADTSTDTSTNADNGAESVIDNADTPASGETGHLSGAELYRSVKEKLKASGLSTAEQRSIRNAIHIASKADEITGGDINKLAAEREAYTQLRMDGEDSLTPEDFIQTVRGDREQLKGILNDIATGAPRLVDELFTDHPDSAKELSIRAMNKLAQLDNERFSSYIAQSAAAYLNDQGLPVEFAVLNEFLPSLPDFPGKNRVIQAIKNVYKAVTGLDAIAAKKFESKANPESTQTATQGSDLEQREANITRYEWNRTAGQANVTLRDAEIARAAGSRKVTLTEKEKSDIKAAVREEFESRLAANRAYGDAMKGYLKNKNQRQYNDRAAAEGKKLLPSIVARHTNAVIDKRTTAKPATTTTAKTTSAAAGPVKDGNGNLIQRIAGPPKTLGLQVDHTRQRPGMMARGEAYIVGQKALHKWTVRTASMSL